MSLDTLMLAESWDELMLDGEEIVTGFRDAYGSYAVGCLDDDPEMGEYEEMLDLARALGHR